MYQAHPLRMEDFAVTCALVPSVPHLRIRFLFVAPRVWIGLPPTPLAVDALALLLAFGSAHTWREDLRLARSVPCLAHTRSISRAGYRVRLSALLACSAGDAHQAVLLEEINPKINTFVYQIKDVEFYDRCRRQKQHCRLLGFFLHPLQPQNRHIHGKD